MGGRGPSAKVCLSAKCCVLAFKASLQYPGSPLPKYPHLPSVMYWYSRHLCSICWGGPLAKLGSSAKFGVLVFKASMINSLAGGPFAKVLFICQVVCTGIQGKYHLSDLKSLIVNWGLFWGCFGHVMGCQGVSRGVKGGYI